VAPQGVRPEDIPLPDWIRQQLDCSGPDGLLCVDRASTVLGWNAAFAGLVGGEDIDAWLLKPLAKALAVDEALLSKLLASADDEGCCRSDAVLKRSNGTSAAVELTARRASAPDEPASFLVQVRPDAAADRGRDVTRNLMELQVQHRMLMNRAGGLILLVDPEQGSILHANEAAEEYFRVPVAQLRGASVTACVESVDGFTSHGDSSVFLGGGPRQTELTIPSPDGDAWVVEFVSNTISWHGRPALFWIGRDVTHRRTAPRQPAAGGVRLPATVVTPLAEQLRHPAARIELAARQCLDSPDRPWHEQRDRLEQIQELGDQVRVVSEDLLYLTRIADGTLDIRRTETTVGRLLAGILPRLQRRARSAGSELMVVQVDEEADVFSDARLLMRSLRGFLDRALDKTGTTVTLTVTVDGDSIRFVIIDTSPDDDRALESLLDPDSVMRTSSGEFATGVQNLPIMLSVHLFRALGGHIEVQASPGLGSQITLTLLC
jgi:signal transduction histidine kinase